MSKPTASERKTILKAITSRPPILALVIAIIGAGLLMLIAAFIFGKIDLGLLAAFATGGSTVEGGRRAYNRLAE